jgi:hypothetical protein
MEHTVRKTMMKTLLSAISILLIWSSGAARQAEPFYNLDTEIRIQGVVRGILFEPRYKDRASFMVIDLEERGTGQTFRVDVSPSWFFDEDLHKGEKVEIVGSLVQASGGLKSVIAREIRLRGETLVLRDQRGFPEWRGGVAGRGARRRGRNR